MTAADDAKEGCLLAGLAAVALVGLLVLGAGGWAGLKAFNRYQAREEAHNAATIARVQAENEQHVNKLRIAAQEQKVQIAKQDAQIRFEQAKGVRAAQDEISRTLTPLYVQMEMINALEEIAKSGKNNTVVYLPSQNGLPLTAQAGAGK
ncbi:hypothetical protein [Actinomadura atramentaria]|uniref:hypothetical protein n=1 Tax=Actinomadura atramentaria TaxID=1990 RepID=UPI000374E665|nr:hypothetical protein [Actinomadura atramentaria]